MANPCPPGQHAGRGSNQYGPNCVPDEPGFAYSPRGTARPLSPRLSMAGGLPRMGSQSPRLSMAGRQSSEYRSPYQGERFQYQGETGLCPTGMQQWGNQYAHHCVPAYHHGRQGEEAETSRTGGAAGLWEGREYRSERKGQEPEFRNLGETGICGPGMENWGNQYAHHCVPAYPHGRQASMGLGGGLGVGLTRAGSQGSLGGRSGSLSGSLGSLSGSLSGRSGSQGGMNYEGHNYEGGNKTWGYEGGKKWY